LIQLVLYSYILYMSDPTGVNSQVWKLSLSPAYIGTVLVLEVAAFLRLIYGVGPSSIFVLWIDDVDFASLTRSFCLCVWPWC